MMGYNEAGQGELTLADTFEARRKLRPLVPRPFLSPTTKVNSTCCNRDIFSLHHHHFGTVQVEQENNNEAVVATQQVVVSSRWNPTPEQLTALEELYRCGTRTPSAEQIQHITSQLRRYGKIEGKNVFYWFQNHKARERQKRRREVHLASETSHFKDPDCLDQINCMNDKGSGANRVSLGVEKNKNFMSWAPSTTSGLLAQESESDAPIKETEKAAEEDAVVVVSSAEQQGWIQFDAREFHNHHNNNNLLSSPSERNATSSQLLKQPLSNTNSSILSLNHHYSPLSLSSSPIFPISSPFFISSKALDLNHLNEDGERKSLTLELLPLVIADGPRNDTVSERESPVPVTRDGEATLDYNAFPYYKFL